MAKKRRKKRKTVYRSAITGRFITKAWAKRSPRTTIKQRVPVNSKKKKRRR